MDIGKSPILHVNKQVSNLFHTEVFPSENPVNLYRDGIFCRAAGEVSNKQKGLN